MMGVKTHGIRNVQRDLTIFRSTPREQLLGLAIFCNSSSIYLFDAGMMVKCSTLLVAFALFVGPAAVTALTSTDYARCTCNPDPHFKTWDDIYYDFHGDCCSVLIQSALLNMHICTSLAAPGGGWAGVDRAALAVGGQILEIQPSDQLLDGTSFSIGTPPASVGGFIFTVSGTPPNEEYKVDLGGGQSITIRRAYGGSLAVDAYGHGSDFSDAQGLCGNWALGGMKGRGGAPAFTPAMGNAYGEEWRYDSSTDPDILVDEPPDAVCDFNAPACGNKRCTCTTGAPDCCGPEDPQCEGLALLAAEACAEVPEGRRKENCEFDVFVTGDQQFAQELVYTEVVVPPPQCVGTDAAGNDECRAMHGRCVWKCDETRSECINELCRGNDNDIFNPPIDDDDCACEILPPCIDIGCKEIGGECVTDCECGTDDNCLCVADKCRPNNELPPDLQKRCLCKIRRPTDKPTTSPSQKPTSSPTMEPRAAPTRSPVTVSFTPPCIDIGCKEIGGECVTDCECGTDDNCICVANRCRPNDELPLELQKLCLCKIPRPTDEPQPTEPTTSPSQKPTSSPMMEPTVSFSPPCRDEGCKNKNGVCVVNCQCDPDECDCEQNLCRPNPDLPSSQQEECLCKIPKGVCIATDDKRCDTIEGAECVLNCDCDPADCFCDKTLCRPKDDFLATLGDEACYCKIPTSSGVCCSEGCEKRGGECVEDCQCPDATVCTCEEDLCFFHPGIPGQDEKKCLCKIPTPSSGGFICFSGDATVQVEGKGSVRMDQLKIGNSVASRDGKYSKVYSFGHFDRASKVEYLQFSTDMKTRLEISSHHLLFVVDKTKDPSHSIPVPAHEVRVGDLLLTAQGRSTRVEAIGKIHRRGLYAPFTLDGTIVADGVVASSYVALPPLFQTVLTFEQQHWLQHLAYAPYRFYCGWMGDAGGCTQETYDKDTGLSKAVMVWLPVLDWLDRQNQVLQSVILRGAILPTLWMLRNMSYIVAAVVGCLVWKKATPGKKKVTDDEEVSKNPS